MSEQVKKFCHERILALYLILAVGIAGGFGYSLGVRESVKAVVDLADQQAKERVSIRRHYALQMGEQRKRYDALEAEYKKLANKAISQ